MSSPASHFLKCASRGGPAGSGGEQRCARLAKMLAKNLDAFTSLDANAIDGFIVLIRAANYGQFYEVKDLLEQAGFRDKK